MIHRINISSILINEPTNHIRFIGSIMSIISYSKFNYEYNFLSKQCVSASGVPKVGRGGGPSQAPSGSRPPNVNTIYIFFTSAGFCNSQHFCSVIIIVYNKNEPER